MAASVKVNIKGIKQTFKEADLEVIAQINSVQRASAFAAVSELQLRTPVDTGRARRSWSLSKSNNPRDAALSQVNTIGILGPIPEAKIETLYITNGTPYIRELNTGSSIQAPPRFIESTLSKYFTFTAGSVKFT